MTISFDYSNALPFMKKSEVSNLSEFVKTAHHMLHEKKDQDPNFLDGLIYHFGMMKTNL